MNPLVSKLACFGLSVCLSWPVMAQNEGKHLGSTQDELRSGGALHTRSAAPPSSTLPANSSGGRYDRATYVPETGMYLDESWQPGYAILQDHSRMDNLMLRYDIYNQQMQFIKGEDTLAFSRPEELDFININGRCFVYEEYVDNGVIGKGYFELLKDGDCKLLLRRTVLYHVKAEELSGNVNEEYLRDVSYFVKKKDQQAKEIRVNKKSVLCLFKDEEENIRQYMKANDLKMKSRDDLVQVVAFYNTLQ